MFSLFFIAFIGGFLTIAAPCILAVLPIILGSTLGNQSRLRPFFIVLGLTVSFTAFGVIFQQVTSLFGLSNNTLRNIALVFLVLFGLALIFPKVFERAIFQIQNFFNRFVGQKSTIFPNKEQEKKGLLNGFLVGASLGLVWVPCAGPILGAILTLAVTQHDLGKIVLLMLAYSLGAGIPMLIIAYGGNWVISRMKFLKQRGAPIQQISGVLLLAGVVFIALGLDIKIADKLADFFPSFSHFEQNLVDSSGINKQLDSNNTKAPELTGTQGWVNSKPLKIADLKGKVVLIDFWTYSCINCIHTLPYVKAWDEKYRDKGLVIIGVHTPEFAFEKELPNLQKAVQDFGIKYPVVQDNDYATWQAYNNHYWPAKYIIDRDGNLRYMHFGEGEYDKTEMVIQELLGEEVGNITAVKVDPEAKIATPEIYLGYKRAEYFGNDENFMLDVPHNFIAPKTFLENAFYLAGEWTIGAESIVAGKTGAKLFMNYQANKINFVADNSDQSRPVKAKVFLDGKPLAKEFYGKDLAADGTFTITKAALYNLVNTGMKSDRHTLMLEFLSPGVKAFTFTFG